MSPRPYRLGRREAGVEDTRERVITAARETFSQDGFFRASLDDVATRAGVARATVYYQFKSKFGLLEAAIEGTIENSPRQRVRDALDLADPAQALRAYMREMTKFWDHDYIFYRNVIGLASVDPDAAEAVDAYDMRRREPLVFLSKRLADAGLLRPEISQKQATDTIWLLSSFRSFDHLFARANLSQKKATELILDLVEAILVDSARK